jgi:hypothetical protein
MVIIWIITFLTLGREVPGVLPTFGANLLVDVGCFACDKQPNCGNCLFGKCSRGLKTPLCCISVITSRVRNN